MKEYVNMQQFALRVGQPVTKVRKAIEGRFIVAARQGQGGSLIDWETQSKRFLQWCGEAKLMPKKSWTKGKMLDLAEPTEEEPEEEAPPQVQLNSNMSIEDLEKLLKSNITMDEVKRIRQIIGALKELEAMRELSGKTIVLEEFVPKFAELGTLIRKSLMAIRPRIATQIAAQTDPFIIGRMLDVEISNVLNQFDRFLKKLKGVTSAKNCCST